jgi:pimeloyl-ACP methyl ester carboxylesterase
MSSRENRDMSERFEVLAGAARLAGERHGDGVGPTVVLLHAGIADRRSWRHVAQALAVGARVVAYDRRGFGETRARPELHSHAADLGAVLDAVGCGPAWLVGNSQGGRIVVDFALGARERVAGLVLVAPAISGEPQPELDDLDARERRLVELAEAAEEAGDLEALNRYDTWFWLDGPREPEGRVGGAPRELVLDMNRRALTAGDVGEATEPPDATARLDDLDVPTLVMWGDRDWSAGCDTAAAVADRLPRGEHCVIEGTAHLPQLERPSEVAGRISAFLARAAT